jgi:uncharacterized membrane protein YgaE (UPF0421/DUF939 family)
MELIRMGIRIIKTALAAALAIFVAALIGLSPANSAGLLAILGIDVTKRKSIVSVATRMGASIVALLVACLVFTLFGYRVWAVGLFILIVYPLLVRVKLHDGIVTGSVVMLHVYTAHEITWRLLTNEIGLLSVGFGIATAINFIYMPNADRKLKAAKEEIEQMFSAIFLEISRHLVDPMHIWDGKELLLAMNALQEGTALARRERENRIFETEDDWSVYFDMRRRQLDFIQRMLDLVSQVYRSLPHGEAVAALFERLRVDVRSPYYSGQVEKQLIELEEEFKRMELPATREEFEVRSALLQLCMELKHFLSVAKLLKKPEPSRVKAENQLYKQTKERHETKK